MSAAAVSPANEQQRMAYDSTDRLGVSALPADQQPATAADGAEAVSTAAGAAAEEPEHPFKTDPGDHAETPFEAYAHLDLLLARLAK